MVQYLVGSTSPLLTMQTATLIHAQTLATPTLFQVEYKTEKQSWLGLVTSHLMRWRYSILAESQHVTKEKENQQPNLGTVQYLPGGGGK